MVASTSSNLIIIIAFKILINLMASSAIMEDLASLSTFTALVVSGYSIVMHLRNYNMPSHQILILRILIMIPVSFPKGYSFFLKVYAIATYFSLTRPENYILFNTIRDW